MIIQIGEFKLVPQHSGWDLIEEVKANKIGEGTMQNPTGEEYSKEIELGYNMQLETCIQKIIHFRLRRNESLVGLSDFLMSYKEEKDKINSILK